MWYHKRPLPLPTGKADSIIPLRMFNTGYFSLLYRMLLTN